MSGDERQAEGAAPAGGEAAGAAEADTAAPDEIRALAERLRELAQRLRQPDLDDTEAAGLAREAAELVSEAGTRLDRALREPADGDTV